MQNEDGVDTDVSDVHERGATSHGYYVDNMASGDKGFVRWQGRDAIQQGPSEGKWTYAGGTGKLKGIQGG